MSKDSSATSKATRLLELMQELDQVVQDQSLVPADAPAHEADAWFNSDDWEASDPAC